MKSFTFPIHFGELNGTPVGDLRLAVSDQGLIAVEWANTQLDFDFYLLPFEPDVVAPYAEQLRDYLEGNRREFTFPIHWASSVPFKGKPCKRYSKSLMGKLAPTQNIALEIHRPRAYRAVGRANATNPMPIVIPCHRLIGTDGKLHGYGGGEGLKTKEWLLRLEGAVIA